MWVVLSVFDKKAEQYGGLYLARNVAVGCRMFADTVVGEGDTVIRQHPEDFALVKLGSFDEETGELIPLAPMRLLEAVEVRDAGNV